MAQELTFNISEDRRKLQGPVEAKNFNLKFGTDDVAITNGNPKQWVQGRIGDNELKQVFVNITEGENNTPKDVAGLFLAFVGIIHDKDGRPHRVVDYKHSTTIDVEHGRFRFDFPDQAFTVAGEYQQAFFMLIKEGPGGGCVATMEFDMQVMANFVFTDLVPEDYITPFNDTVDQLLAACKKFKDDTAADEAKFKQELEDAYAKFQKDTNTQFNNFKDATNDTYAKFQKDTNTQLNNFKDATDEDLANFKKANADDIAKFKQQYADAVKAKEDELQSKVDSYTDKIDTMLKDLNQQGIDTSTMLTDLRSQMAALQDKINNEHFFTEDEAKQLEQRLNQSLATMFGDPSLYKEPGEKLVDKIINEADDRGINVRHFGAVGDGKTDDTDAIQKAINYAAQNGGGKIIFGPRPYVVDQLNIVSPAISLVGARTTVPTAGTRLISKPGVNGGALINLFHEGKGGQYDMQTSGSIQNMAILGYPERQSLDNAVDRIGLRITNYAEFPLTNVYIAGFTGGGLVAKDWWDSTVTGLEIRASGTKDKSPALYLGSDDDSTNSIHFFGLHIEHCPYAMKVDGLSSNIQFVASKFEADISSEQASQDMIYIYEGVYATMFDSCLFTENVNATWLNIRNNETTIINSSFTGSNGIIIKNESLNGNYGHGLQLTNNVFDQIGNDKDFIQLGDQSVFNNNYVNLSSKATGNIVFGSKSTVRSNRFHFNNSNAHIKFNGPLTRLNDNVYDGMPKDPFTGNIDVYVDDRYYEQYSATDHIDIDFNSTFIRHNIIWERGDHGPQVLSLSDLRNPFSHEVINIAVNSEGFSIAEDAHFGSNTEYKVTQGENVTLVWLAPLHTWIVKKTRSNFP